MDSIFTYTDYRAFLKAYVIEKKKENRGFSYKVFADRAGFKARDYILRVIQGSRNLSQSGACMLSRALKFSEKETDYFTNLVGFNQAHTAYEKEYFFKKITDNRKFGKHTRLLQEQFEYLSEWYYSAIRSLLPVMDFKDDFAALGKFLDPPIPPGQVKNAVEQLLKWGLLERLASGKYVTPSSSVSSGDEVASLALVRFHKQSLDLARRALDYIPGMKRDISGVTMSLSKDGFEKVKEETQRFRKRIMDIAESDAREDGAYQLNIQLFPLSKRRNPT